MISLAPALVLRGIGRRFDGGVVALDGVSLTLLPGEIHALCGENGAGKSTLAAIAAGALRPTSGERETTGRVGLVHQHFELAQRLRVWENVVLGHEPGRGPVLSARHGKARVRELAREHGLDVDPDAVVEDLPVGVAQRVEILRELAREPSVLILDEPTAVLAPAEIDTLFTTLRGLARHGVAILVVTHKLGEVIAHADRVTVLRAGRVVFAAAASATSVPEIARAMVGGELPGVSAREVRTLRPCLQVEDVRAGTGAHALAGATLEVACGEIVGIAGVEGNGQTALADALTGALPHGGTITIFGRTLRSGSVRDALDAGVRSIPQDRRREALVLPWSIADNASLGDHRRPPFRSGALRVRRATAERAQAIIERLDLRPASARARAGTLSGGNQQKVVVGRALAGEPRLLIAYQPTRGVDIGAAALVQSRLVEARNAGVAVLLIGFELDEILALADRVLVIYGGHIAGSFERAELDRGRIGELMAGTSEMRSYGPGNAEIPLAD